MRFPALPGHGQQPPGDYAYRTDTLARLWSNNFSLGTRSVAGAAVGRSDHWFRYVLEYLQTYLGGDSGLIDGDSTDAAFLGKQSELSSNDPPMARLSD